MRPVRVKGAQKPVQKAHSNRFAQVEHNDIAFCHISGVCYS